MMAARNKKISDIMTEMPSYFMKKGKVTLKQGTDISKIFSSITGKFSGEKMSQIDGLRIDFRKNEEFKNGWVHLRSSNTEPVFRIIAESDSAEKTDRIYKYFAGLIK